MGLDTILLQPGAFVVTGGRHSGKLMLVLTLLSKAKCQSPLLISPFEKSSSERKLSYVAELASNNKGCIAFDLLFATQGWRERKRDFGFSFLIDDLSRVITTHPSDSVILHRVDAFFEVQDRVHIELFVSALSQAAKLANKRLFFTLTHDEALPQFQASIERYMDLELLISRPTVNTDSRHVSVVYASQPLVNSHFQLVRHINDDFALLVEGTEVHKPSFVSSRVLLVCEDEQLISRIKYLFANSVHTVDVVSTEMAQIMRVVSQDTKMILCAASDELAVPISFVAREQEIPLVRISDNDYVRKLDRLKANKQGCVALLERQFFVEDFALAMQSALGDEVYEGIHEKPTPPAFWADEQAQLFDYAEKLLTQSVMFTLFHLRIPNIDFDQVDALISARSTDMAFFDEATSTLKFLAVNLLPEHSQLLMNKLGSDGAKVELLSYQDASQFVSEVMQ